MLLLDRWGSPCSPSSAAPERSAGHQPRRGWRPLQRTVRLVAVGRMRRQRDRTRGNCLVCAMCCDASRLEQHCHAASLAYGVSHALTNASIYLTAPCATVTPTRRPHAPVVRTTAEGQAAHKPDEYWAFRRPNAQVQRRRSEAQGTDPAGVGVRCNAQLGWWQWAGCAGSQLAHEATAWCARCAV